MAIYGSMSWLNEVQQRLNQDSQVTTDAKTLTADFQYVIQPDEVLKEVITCGWRIESGKCTDVWEGMRETDFVLLGPYSTFKRVNLGEVSANEVMVSGEIQVQGDQAELMRNYTGIGAIQAVLEQLAREGVTEWPA